ncbi:hypothetical protein NE848_14905 [Gramella jeungdoensis]|uniref:PLAT domain-containing protein n=1 Tax=Gramella jeungdoensis TaxID=708091 RepID=A0ABT0Z4M9_9FLAO|nr:hypothetical protein [Gramella jeungdoensis]MCM8570683.1 hypothetical protein [Gramella jeungdoensis]
MSYFTKTTLSCLLILFLFIGCSDDDNQDLSNEIYMSVKIDGVDYNMNSKTSTLTATRIIGAAGISKLKVEAISADGQSLRFIIPQYAGKNLYMIGDNPMLPNIIEYESASPYGNWFCNHPGPNEVEKNYVEITGDDGKIIEGLFSFAGQNFEDNSIRHITDGRFRLSTN